MRLRAIKKERVQLQEKVGFMLRSELGITHDSYTIIGFIITTLTSNILFISHY